MTQDDLTRWIEAYERAWRAPGTEALAGLFTPGASYSPAPFDEPLRGLGAIAAFWEAERQGPDETFTLDARVVAVDGQTGVARLEVRYGDPVAQVYRDIWIVTLEPDGRAAAFEEWPIWPERGRVDGGAEG